MGNKTPKKFAIQQIFELLLRKPDDDQIVAYLTDVKTSGLENTMEMVYPSGGRGNVYIGVGFGHTKRARMNVTMATWNTDVMATQNGVVVEEDVASATYYDIIEAGESGELKTKYPALGEKNKEIMYLYKVADDGTYEKTFNQSDTGDATTGKFSYASETKTFTFESGETPVKGDIYACAYEFKPVDSKRIRISGDSIPDTVKLTAYGIVKDVCNGKKYLAILEGMVQIDGNWNFDLSADGEPAVQSLNMEFVRGCRVKDLYTFTVVYDPEDESEIV